MRITSVTLRCYRVHRELHVDLDPSRTIIGGANETGKSTLAEAMHRALFLKAKGNSESHRHMTSSLHGGHPEVEVTFEACGTTYHLRKRFGSAGTAVLSSADSSARSGDDAESELARVLSVEVGTAGKTMLAQWAHLWVWQGDAGGDPTVYATAQQDALLQRLQDMGGAGAIQSDLDARVASRFNAELEQMFTQSGKAKVGSALESAERNEEAADAELMRADGRLRRLESAVIDLERASQDLVVVGASGAALEKEEKEAAIKAAELARLNTQQLEDTHAANDASTRFRDLQSLHERIALIREEGRAVEEDIRPQQDSIARLELIRGDALSAMSVAEAAHRTAADSSRLARMRRDLASARAVLFEKQELHAKLSAKEALVAVTRHKSAELDVQIGALPKVDKPKLKKIRKLDGALSNASAALRAMATGVELLAAKESVTIDGRLIAIGKPEVLTDDTEVQFGSGARLRIRPGGTTLAEARRVESDASDELQALLDSLGLSSEEHAAEVHALRDELTSQLKAVRAQLEGMEADGLTEERGDASAGLAKAKADVERLEALGLGLPEQSGKVAAGELKESTERQVADAEDQEQDAAIARDACAEALSDTDEELTETTEAIRKQQQALSDGKAQLALLVSNHGDDAVRAQALLALESSVTESQRALDATNGAITALQPELVERDLTRIKRAIGEKNSEQSDLRSRVAVARATLRTDGSEDPTAAVATARARADSIGEHLRSVKRRANAVKLLDRLFQEEQTTMANRLTQPLADKMSGYLQCIFGADARAQVELEANQFQRLRLVRPDLGIGAFGFDELSGGAKEQVASAVRLAMAEVLAADYDGCLPIVFDDAFAYSDPERVSKVQRMLDLAASRGLQIIVLTCNPADYAALGAKTLGLRAPESRSVLAPASTGDLEGAPADEDEGPRADEQHPGVSQPGSVNDQQRMAVLDLLRKLGGSKGNETLRSELGWDEATYVSVKDDLVAAGRLVRRKGRGGSVSLPNS